MVDMRRLRAVGELIGVLIASIIMQAIFALAFAVVLTLLGTSGSTTFAVFGLLVFGEAAFIVMAYFYLSEKQYPLPTLAKPSIAQSRVLLLAPLLAITVAIALNFILMQFETTGEQVVTGTVDLSIWTRIAFVVASFLVIAPAEEALFRGAFHAHLRTFFSETGVVVIASALFLVVHIPNVLGTVLPAAVAGLTAVGLLSTLAGFAYERTDNLMIPILIHGLYNATLFLIPLVL